MTQHTSWPQLDWSGNSLTTASRSGQPSFIQISNLDLTVSDVIESKSGHKMCSMYCSTYSILCVLSSKIYYVSSAPAEGVLTILSEGGVGPDCVAKKIRYTSWAPALPSAHPLYY